ncbi:MAG: ATP-dependent helicase [Bacteroidia bacterium]|jgi:DNA helicase-2/ATP-dependent DNA helicase PcrA|nr:ATP-dependent helicase [Bacteroidia bacterium]
MSIDFNELFKTELTKLNKEQQEAVFTTEGPVLVIAGPGTGKTQILAARIANIISLSDNKPEDILCLTYTDAGAIAMRKRLLQFIGPDAYKVEVQTFHAFCNMVIQDNLDYFGLRGLDAISELEQIQFVHQIIDGFPANHPLKRYTGEVYYETSKLINLYAQMKRENWTALYLEKHIDAYLEDIKTRDEFIYKRNSKYGKAGELKVKEYELEVQKMNQLKAAAETFEQYQQLLKKHSRYDFADMILWVIEAFQQKPEMLNHYQERYQYVLVDEYQDTSGAQNEVLSLLISYWDSPNVFCVGDDDQSIYRFQGANVENILLFKKRYAHQGLTEISLVENYRSTQKILDAAKALIQNNTLRINPDKHLLAKGASNQGETIAPVITEYHNTYHEAVAITNKIIALKNNGVQCNEIAVIYRKHAQAEDMIKYLQQIGIAVNTKKRIDVLHEPIIKKLLQILRYISAENTKVHSGEVFIYELLHYDFFAIPPIEIAKVSVQVYSKNFNERKTSWREEIKSALKKKTADLFNQEKEEGKQMAYASKIIEGWIAAGINLTTQQLIERVINESGILVQSLTGADKRMNMQVLQTFFDFVKSECAKNPRLQLKHLLALIELMQKEQVSLAVQLISFAEDGVNFLTAHSSKGLEFSHVFMLGCNAKTWEQNKPIHEYKLPDNLYLSVNEQYQEMDDTAENRRLFYVAMTRAKKELHISYAKYDNNGKDLEKSRFVAELESNSSLISQYVALSDDDLITFQASVLSPAYAPPPSSLFDNEFVDELLQKYSLSVTHLNNYLKCPTAFYFNNLIRVPAPLSASMTFGSAVHYALEMLFRNMNAHPLKQFTSVNQVVNDFKWYMKRYEDSFVENEYKLRVEYGENILLGFYEKYIDEWNKITSVERSYRNVVMEGVPLNGKLDKIEFDGSHANVVDYKTGQYEKAKSKFLPPQPEKVEKSVAANKPVKFEDEYGGDYWRQAVFYKILIDHDKHTSWQMQSAEFDFVEPDKQTSDYIKHRVHINHNDIAIVKQQIITAYSNIKAKKFNNGCGDENCTWCSFVNTYYAGTNELSINLSDTVNDEDV